MNPIVQQLLQSGCIEKEQYSESKEYIDGISKLREDFLSELERKNEQQKKSWMEIHEEELQLITEIKELIKTSAFKRAYRSSEYKDMIKLCLEMLEDNRIECTKGLGELKKMKEFIQEQIDHQKQIDSRNLNKIQKQVGSKIWNDFQLHFQSEEFLNLLRENK